MEYIAYIDMTTEAGIGVRYFAVWHVHKAFQWDEYSDYDIIVIKRTDNPFLDTSFSVSLVGLAACSFGKLIKPWKQAGSMLYLLANSIIPVPTECGKVEKYYRRLRKF
jgi:hypothetical protein